MSQLRASGPMGEQLFVVDRQVIGDAETVEMTGEAPGAYRLRIIPSEPQAPSGIYEITFTELGVATERHKMRIAAARALTAGMSSRRAGTREAFLQAIAEVEKALAYWRAAQDRIEEANALFTIGLLYIEIGDRARALQNTTEALVVARSTLDRRITGRALEAIARVHNSFGDKRKAIEYCEQALPLLRAVNDRAGEGNALDNLAVAWSGIGEKRRALDYFDQAVQIFRELQDRRMLAELAGNIGVTYDNLGEYQRALESHQSSLVLVRELADRATEAVAMNNIGSAYSGLGEYQKALDAYTAALEINRSRSTTSGTSPINLQQHRVGLWATGRSAAGAQVLPGDRSSWFATSRTSEGSATTLNNIGDDLCRVGRLSAKRSRFIAKRLHSAARWATPMEKRIRSTTRTGATQSSATGKGRDNIERALAIHRPSETATCWLASLAQPRRARPGSRRCRTRRVAALDEALRSAGHPGSQGRSRKHWPNWRRVERDRGNLAHGAGARGRGARRVGIDPAGSHEPSAARFPRRIRAGRAGTRDRSADAPARSSSPRGDLPRPRCSPASEAARARCSRCSANRARRSAVASMRHCSRGSANWNGSSPRRRSCRRGC